MKKTFTKILSAILCFAIIASIGMTTYASSSKFTNGYNPTHPCKVSQSGYYFSSSSGYGYISNGKTYLKSSDFNNIYKIKVYPSEKNVAGNFIQLGGRIYFAEKLSSGYMYVRKYSNNTVVSIDNDSLFYALSEYSYVLKGGWYNVKYNNQWFWVYAEKDYYYLESRYIYSSKIGGYYCTGSYKNTPFPAQIYGMGYFGNNKVITDKSTGKIINGGFVMCDGKWYLVDTNGKVLYGWQKYNNTWYYFDYSTGVMKTGWQKISNKWYYFNSSGAMLTGWQKISGKWYYFEASGTMRTANLTYKGKVYRFNSSGVCLNP